MEKRVRLCFSIMIFLISIRMIMFVTIPFVIDDEFCYWSIAAFFNKMDWSGVTQYCSYYNWGYSMLLAIVLKFSPNILIAYKVAIILNGIWMCIAYNLIVAVWHMMSGKRNYIWLPNITALVACLLPNILVDTNITWPECFSIFLCWLGIYNLTKYSYGHEKKNIYFFNIVVIVLYLVHKRFLGFLVAVIILDYVLLLKKNISKKDMFFFGLIFLSGIYINEIIKTVLIDSLWRNSSTVISNNMEGQIGKVANIFSSFHGFFAMLIGLLGQVYAITIETGAIVLFGGFFLLKHSFSFITRKEDSPASIVYFYVFMAAFMTIGISVIFLSSRNRVDQLFYVRYIAVVMQILFIFGVGNIMRLQCDNLRILKGVFLLALVIIGSGYILQYTIARENLYSFNHIMSVLLSFFIQSNKGLILPSILSIGFFAALLKYRVSNHKPILYLLLGLGILFYGVVQFRTDREVMTQTGNDYRLANSIVDKIGREGKTYYLLEDHIWKNRGKNAVQFLSPYNTIEGIHGKNLDLIEMENAEIVLWSNSKYIYNIQLMKGFHQEQQGDYSKETLVVLSDSGKKENKVQLNLYDMSIGNGVMRQGSCIRQQEIVEEDVPLAFGPYIYLSEGQYVLDIDMTLLDNASENTSLGFIVVAGENGEYALSNIARSDFDEKKGTVQIAIELFDTDPKFEIAIYSKAGSLLQVDGIEIERLNV